MANTYREEKHSNYTKTCTCMHRKLKDYYMRPSIILLTVTLVTTETEQRRLFKNDSVLQGEKYEARY